MGVQSFSHFLSLMDIIGLFIYLFYSIFLSFPKFKMIMIIVTLGVQSFGCSKLCYIGCSKYMGVQSFVTLGALHCNYDYSLPLYFWSVRSLYLSLLILKKKKKKDCNTFLFAYLQSKSSNRTISFLMNFKQMSLTKSEGTDGNKLKPHLRVGKVFITNELR